MPQLQFVKSLVCSCSRSSFGHLGSPGTLLGAVWTALAHQKRCWDSSFGTSAVFRSSEHALDTNRALAERRKYRGITALCLQAFSSFRTMTNPPRPKLRQVVWCWCCGSSSERMGFLGALLSASKPALSPPERSWDSSSGTSAVFRSLNCAIYTHHAPSERRKYRWLMSLCVPTPAFSLSATLGLPESPSDMHYSLQRGGFREAFGDPPRCSPSCVTAFQITAIFSQAQALCAIKTTRYKTRRL